MKQVQAALAGYPIAGRATADAMTLFIQTDFSPCCNDNQSRPEKGSGPLPGSQDYGSIPPEKDNNLLTEY
jgi:hypothetical protein